MKRSGEMHQGFRESERAVSWFVTALMSDFPDDEAEVVRVTNGRIVRVFCPMGQVHYLLERYCRSFFRPMVHYHPDNGHGYVGEIRTSEHPKRSDEDQARVAVLLSRTRNEEQVEMAHKASVAPRVRTTY